jgi:hypothetical protein
MASPAAAAMNPSGVSGDPIMPTSTPRARVRWLAELVGFPLARGAGLLTSGASAARIVCFDPPDALADALVRRRALVTGTIFGGRETLRACVLCPTRARSTWRRSSPKSSRPPAHSSPPNQRARRRPPRKRSPLARVFVECR